jgi:hypothetical protein
VSIELLRGFGAVLSVGEDLGGAAVTETRVEPGSIVEDLDVFGNRLAGFRSGREYRPMNEFVLQRREKRFREGVVPALPDPSHRAPQVQNA